MATEDQYVVNKIWQEEIEDPSRLQRLKTPSCDTSDAHILSSITTAFIKSYKTEG